MEEKSKDLIQYNLMNEMGYAPYCGSNACASFSRTRFNGSQFRCHCGWESKFDKEFIRGYKEKWKLPK